MLMNQNKFPASDDVRVVIAVTRRVPPVEEELLISFSNI
jgi:hypothetical protein